MKNVGLAYIENQHIYSNQKSILVSKSLSIVMYNISINMKQNFHRSYIRDKK